MSGCRRWSERVAKDSSRSGHVCPGGVAPSGVPLRQREGREPSQRVWRRRVSRRKGAVSGGGGARARCARHTRATHQIFFHNSGRFNPRAKRAPHAADGVIWAGGGRRLVLQGLLLLWRSGCDSARVRRSVVRAAWRLRHDGGRAHGGHFRLLVSSVLRHRVLGALPPSSIAQEVAGGPRHVGASRGDCPVCLRAAPRLCGPRALYPKAPPSWASRPHRRIPSATSRGTCPPVKRCPTATARRLLPSSHGPPPRWRGSWTQTDAR